MSENLTTDSEDFVQEPDNSKSANIWDSLREAREARDWTITEVSERLKLTPRQIEAMEAGALDVLPGPAFTRGFVRNYVGLLELDVAPYMQALDPLPTEAAVSKTASNLADMPSEQRKSSRVGLVVGGVGLVLVALIVFGWANKWFEPRDGKTLADVIVQSAAVTQHEVANPMQPATRTESSTALPSSPASAPVTIQPAQVVTQSVPQTVAGGTNRIVFNFSKSSWTQVRDGSGKIILRDQIPAGSTREVEGKGPFSLVVGNAQSVEVIYKDQPVDLTPYIGQGNVARFKLPQ